MTPTEILNETIDYYLNKGKSIVEDIDKELKNKLIFNTEVINPIIIKLPYDFINKQEIINSYKLKYNWENIIIENENDSIYNYINKYSDLPRNCINIRITKLSFYHNITI